MIDLAAKFHALPTGGKVAIAAGAGIGVLFALGKVGKGSTPALSSSVSGQAAATGPDSVAVGYPGGTVLPIDIYINAPSGPGPGSTPGPSSSPPEPSPSPPSTTTGGIITAPAGTGDPGTPAIPYMPQPSPSPNPSPVLSPDPVYAGPTVIVPGWTSPQGTPTPTAAAPAPAYGVIDLWSSQLVPNNPPPPSNPVVTPTTQAGGSRLPITERPS